MQTDSSRRHRLGMAALCAITMAAGIARTRLAQEAINPDVHLAVPDNRDERHDPAPDDAASHPDGGVPR